MLWIGTVATRSSGDASCDKSKWISIHIRLILTIHELFTENEFEIIFYSKPRAVFISDAMLCVNFCRTTFCGALQAEWDDKGCSWHVVFGLCVMKIRISGCISLTDYVYFETSTTTPYQIRRIEELCKVFERLLRVIILPRFESWSTRSNVAGLARLVRNSSASLGDLSISLLISTVLMHAWRWVWSLWWDSTSVHLAQKIVYTDLKRPVSSINNFVLEK